MPGATDTTLPIRGEHFRSTDQESCLTSFGPASAAVDRTATRRSCRGLLGSPRFCRVGQARAGAAEASRSSATPPQTGGPPRSCGCSVQVSCRYLPHGSSSTTQSHRQVLRKYSRTYPAGAAPALTYTGSRWSRPPEFDTNRCKCLIHIGQALENATTAAASGRRWSAS